MLRQPKTFLPTSRTPGACRRALFRRLHTLHIHQQPVLVGQRTNIFRRCKRWRRQHIHEIVPSHRRLCSLQRRPAWHRGMWRPRHYVRPLMHTTPKLVTLSKSHLGVSEGIGEYQAGQSEGSVFDRPASTFAVISLGRQCTSIKPSSRRRPRQKHSEICDYYVGTKMDASSSAGISPLKTSRQWKAKGGKSHLEKPLACQTRFIAEYQCNIDVLYQSSSTSDGHGGITGLQPCTDGLC